MLRFFVCLLAVVTIALGCSSSSSSSGGAAPAPSEPARARELSDAAAARVAAGEDPTVVVADLRRAVEEEPLFDAASVELSQSGRSLAFRTKSGIPYAFFANRHLPGREVATRPLALPEPSGSPPEPLSVLLLDPESARPKLGQNYATSAADLAALFRSAGHAPERVHHRSGALTMDDWRKSAESDVLYFFGDGDAFGEWSGLVSGVDGDLEALLASGDVVPGAPLAEQRAMLTMDGAEVVLTHAFFLALPKAPRIAFLNGFPAGARDHFHYALSTRGTQEYAASLLPAWTSDVDYLAFRVFEELLGGRDVRRVHELARHLSAGDFAYHGSGMLFQGCDEICRLACVEPMALRFDDEEAAWVLCNRIADNELADVPERAGDPPVADDEGEGTKKHAADDGGEVERGQVVTTTNPPPTPGCTQMQLDNELATFTNAYMAYVTSLGRKFRGCLDITQDLHFVFIKLVPRLQCWTAGIAWRLTVYRNRFWCTSNFMHNAFLLTPKTYQFGHQPTVFDPYELSDGVAHTPRIQSMMEFTKDAHWGGAEHGKNNVSRTREMERAQLTIDGNADNPRCKDIYECLAKEYPGKLRNSCK